MPRSAGIDFGRHSDPTALTVLDYSQEPWEVVTQLELLHCSWEQQLGLICTHTLGCLPIFVDGTGIGDALYERIPGATAVVLRNDTKRFNRLLGPDRISVDTQTLFAPMLHRISIGGIKVKCQAATLEQNLQNFIVKYTKTGRPRFEARRGHDDDVFSLALAVYGATVVGGIQDATENQARRHIKPFNGSGTGRAEIQRLYHSARFGR